MHKGWLDPFDFFFFDFDGLLVNTEELHWKAYQKVCTFYECDLDWDFPKYCSYAHHSTEVLRDAVFSYLPQLRKQESCWNIIRQKKNAIYQELIEAKSVTLMPGVKEVLSYLEQTKKKACVVSNSPNHHLELIRHQLPMLDQIPYWIGRSDYSLPKPHPDGYLTGLEKYVPKDCLSIGFEDSMKGLKALRQTPIVPVLISDLHHEGFSSIPQDTMRFNSFYDALNFHHLA